MLESMLFVVFIVLDAIVLALCILSLVIAMIPGAFFEIHTRFYDMVCLPVYRTIYHTLGWSCDWCCHICHRQPAHYFETLEDERVNDDSSDESGSQPATTPVFENDIEDCMLENASNLEAVYDDDWNILM